MVDIRSQKKNQLVFDQSKYIGQALICITYDDGLLDNYTLAVPAHLEHGVTASFAIITNRLLSAEYHHKYINITQMQEMYDLGFEISSHGFYHQKKYPELTEVELDIELNISKKVLGGLLGAEIKSICIPYGRSNDLVNKEAFKHYKIIRLFGYKLTKVNDIANPLDAYPILNTTEIEKVKTWINNAVKQKKLITLMFHGIAKDSSKKGEYYFSEEKLKHILQYIAELGEENILPVRLCDLVELCDVQKKINTSNGSYETNKIYEEVIVEKEDFMMTYHGHKKPSNKLIITFGGLPSGKTKKGFGTDFALSLGYDTIFVAQKEKTQYQGLSLDDFYKYTQKYIGDRECITYGSSLGAYCAIYYAGVINARAIAAAPKNSAHPIIGRREYSIIGFKHREISENPVSAEDPVIIYDPHHMDESKYIDKLILPVYSNARLVKVPFAGHTILQAMKLSKVLSPFIKNIIENNIIIKFSLDDEDSYIWNGEKGRFLIKSGDIEKGLEYLYRSLSIYPNKEALEYLVNHYVKQNDVSKIEYLCDLYVHNKKIIPTIATYQKIEKILRDK